MDENAEGSKYLSGNGGHRGHLLKMPTDPAV